MASLEQGGPVRTGTTSVQECSLPPTKPATHGELGRRSDPPKKVDTNVGQIREIEEGSAGAEPRKEGD